MYVRTRTNILKTLRGNLFLRKNVQKTGETILYSALFIVTISLVNALSFAITSNQQNPNPSTSNGIERAKMLIYWLFMDEWKENLAETLYLLGTFKVMYGFFMFFVSIGFTYFFVNTSSDPVDNTLFPVTLKTGMKRLGYWREKSVKELPNYLLVTGVLFGFLFLRSVLFFVSHEWYYYLRVFSGFIVLGYLLSVTKTVTYYLRYVTFLVKYSLWEQEYLRYLDAETRRKLIEQARK